ncbi:MAG: Grx4 family monothiol glutaredoxin [Rhodanobacter denitrificans]|uniref:Grx4 family monothiol glutaredoxin n=1 Tax=Rhodanobacter denitrificans TaxID=666685 RepID=A0A2W5KFK2_9GAMM|nr:MAG: Grx4 family monothiol glutaredoxin [Rhodanobacter denitrificans]
MSAVRTRIEALLAAHPVILFMKGTREAPRCGFSAAAVERLDEVLDDYLGVDVLEDEAIRQGIKEYGNWPTIPQLYVNGELVGGSDIIQSLYDSGELHRLFGRPEPDRSPPDLVISDRAVAAIREAMADVGDAKLFLAIDSRFQPQFQFREAGSADIAVEVNGLEVRFDVASAQRARGARIDWVETEHGSGLSIQLPLAPKGVRDLDVRTLRERLAAGDITVIDVRPAADRAAAPFAAAEVLDADSHARLIGLDKGTPLAFLCHHGNSSRQAAEYFRERGFRDLYNVTGGIDAWSREIDPSVPRY